MSLLSSRLRTSEEVTESVTRTLPNLIKTASALKINRTLIGRINTHTFELTVLITDIPLVSGRIVNDNFIGKLYSNKI